MRISDFKGSLIRNYSDDTESMLKKVDERIGAS